MRSHLKVFFDFEERTEMLNDAEKGRLLMAMLRYAKGGEIPDLKGNERFLWPVFKGDIDRDAAAYEAHVQSGGLGGRPKNQTKPNETKENQTETKRNQNAQDRRKKTEDEEQDQEKGTARTRATPFAPPSVDEVAAYCLERGNRVNARAFVDFYTAKGWRVGNQAMKDWRAAVRTWEQREQGESPPAKVVSAQQYEQREYSREFLDSIGWQPTDEEIREAAGR